MDTPERALLSIESVADYLGGITQRAVYKRLVEDSTFPRPYKVGKRNYWKRQDLDRWISRLPQRTT